MPGDGGSINADNVTDTTLDLVWTLASDDVSAQENLHYKVVTSNINNIETVTNAESNGTVVQDWSPNIVQYNIFGLEEGTAYYFNIIVMDEGGNKSLYTTGNYSTADITQPVPGNSGIISASNLQPASLDLSWTKGSDNVSDQSLLEYIVYRSGANNISSVTDAEANGTLVHDWTTDIASCNVADLTPDSIFYFNVIVRDQNNNDSAYTMINETTETGGTWSEPADLSDNISPDGQDAYNPRIAMNDSGAVVIVWHQVDGSANSQIFMSECR